MAVPVSAAWRNSSPLQRQGSPPSTALACEATRRQVLLHPMALSAVALLLPALCSPQLSEAAAGIYQDVADQPRPPKSKLPRGEAGAKII